MMTSKEYAYREKILAEYRRQAEMQYDARMEMNRRVNDMDSGFSYYLNAEKAHRTAMDALASCLNERDRMVLPTIRKEAMDGYEARVANEETCY